MARRKHIEESATAVDDYEAFRAKWLRRFEVMHPNGTPDDAERFVAARVAGRSGWAPADDFSVVGPYAAPANIVAEHRAAFARGRGR